MIFAFALLDGSIIDAGDSKPHEAMLVEFPVLIAVAAEPITAVIVPLIGEAHRDTVLAKRPDFLDQAVVEFPAPLARQERFDRFTKLFRKARSPAASEELAHRQCIVRSATFTGFVRPSILNGQALAS